MSKELRFRPATEAEFETLLDLSIRVMRADLERVLRFDPARRRARMREAFDAGGMRVIELKGTRAGCIGVEPGPDAVALHSFYLEPAFQRRGLGTAVMRALLAEYQGHSWRLEVLKQSPARLFWERQGFRLVGESDFDWLMQRPAD